MQLDRGLAVCLCALSASRAPLETFHQGTLPQHRGNSCAWHGHAALGNKSPQGESGYLPGQATKEFQPLYSFSLSSSVPRLTCTQYARLQPPDFENRGMLLLTRATLLYMHIMRGGMLYTQSV